MHRTGLTFPVLQKEEHAITGLQSQVRSKKPNEPLLQKLKEEMMKIQMQRVMLDFCVILYVGGACSFPCVCLLVPLCV